MQNRYPGKCQSCNVPLAAGEGFAYKNGYRWLQCCNSTACINRLGLKAPASADIRGERKITEIGEIIMGFDRDAVPLIKSLPGARWNPDNKLWTVSVIPRDLPRVIEVCDQLKLDIPESLRASLNAGTVDSNKARARAEAARRHDGKTLFEFQKDGVVFLALHDHALLADDMGLGKSVQALVALPDNAQVLLICPAAVKYNWQNEAKMWRPEFETIVCEGKDSFVLPKPNQIVIINYEILPAFLVPKEVEGKLTKSGKPYKEAPIPDDIRKELKNVILIGDEFHKVKNYKSMMSQKIGAMTKLCKVVWALTGTPLMTRPQDLFGMLASGNMYPFGSWDKFVERFNGYRGQYGIVFGNPKPEVPEMLKRVSIRRLKTEVLKDLPTKIYKDILVDIDKTLKKYLDKVTLEIAINQGHVITDEEIADAKKNMDDVALKINMNDLPNFKEFSTIRRMLAEARIPAMMEIVESYEDSETPLVVFSAHTKPLEELGKRDGWGIITGDTPAVTREKAKQDFQAGKLKGIAVAIKAGGVGITLTHASHALFVDLDWTPGLNIQAEDRICRIGATTENVLIQRMTSNHPMDQHINKLICKKIALMYEALDKSIKVKPLKKRPEKIELVEETEADMLARIEAAGKEAEKQFYKDKVHGILGRELARAEGIPEPKLTPKRKELILRALDYMASRCDGAESRDYMGFNKPDAAIAQWLYGAEFAEDEVIWRVTERILSRYYRQLVTIGKEFGEDFTAIWKPDV